MLRTLTYYVGVPLLYGLSRLPPPLLYALSWGTYWTTCHVFRYRRKVVDRNLRAAFPEKSPEQRFQIARNCYRHLANLLVEVVRNLTIPTEVVRRQITLRNPELAEAQFLAGRSIVFLLGHYGNWESGANAVALNLSKPFYGIYHAFSSSRTDRLVQRVRTRHGMRLVEMRETLRHFVATQHQIVSTAFIADQAGAPESSYWTTFLNQDTPFMQGAEKLARRFGHAVVYAEVLPLRRAQYEVVFDLITPNAQQTAPGEIMKGYVQRLETTIRRDPAFWLWTHKRWKHQRPAAE